MAFLVPSAFSGFGSGLLANIMRGNIGQMALKGALSPAFTSAFTYGMASSLACRGVEYIATKLCHYYQLDEKETIALTIGVIAFQVFSSYGIANQLGISRNFVHLENVLFMASVIEIDFDLTVHRINDQVCTHAADKRLTAEAWRFVQAIYHEIMGALNE